MTKTPSGCKIAMSEENKQCEAQTENQKWRVTLFCPRYFVT